MSDSHQPTCFHYYTGERVLEGDIIKTGNGKLGAVEKVIVSGSADSVAFSCPEGGVLINEDWDGTPSFLLLTPPDGVYWEDLVFIRRQKKSV
jgi:hypothetical protein